jgi:tRNA A-37 threonylcarbamoyl transferase component Bud32
MNDSTINFNVVNAPAQDSIAKPKERGLRAFFGHVIKFIGDCPKLIGQVAVKVESLVQNSSRKEGADTSNIKEIKQETNVPWVRAKPQQKSPPKLGMVFQKVVQHEEPAHPIVSVPKYGDDIKKQIQPRHAELMENSNGQLILCINKAKEGAPPEYLDFKLRSNRVDENKDQLFDEIADILQQNDIQDAGSFLEGLYEAEEKEIQEKTDSLFGELKKVLSVVDHQELFAISDQIVGRGSQEDVVQVGEKFIHIKLNKHSKTYQVDHLAKGILLGKGSFGNVYQANQNLALKEYHKPGIEEGDVVMLHHVNGESEHIGIQSTPKRVVQLDRFGNTLNVGHLTKRCDGDYLRYIKENGRQNKEQSYNQAWQLLKGLSHIHEKGVAHRDIKLENILFNRNPGKAPSLYISDFGLAVSQKTIEEDPGVGGTNAYILKEDLYTAQAYLKKGDYEGYIEFAKTMDTFAMGCVLYGILTGKAAFPKDAKGHPIVDNYKSLEFPKDIPKEFQSLVKKMLHPDANQRPSSSFNLFHIESLMRREGIKVG